MTKAPPGFTRTLLSIAVPVTLQNLLASSFTLIDTMMIGKLGDTPLAAVGMAGKWTWFLTIVFFGFSSGASVFISQFYGAGDDAGMRRTYGLMTVGTQAAALLFMLAALLFPDGIVRLFSSDEQAIALGASYLRIIALSYPFLALTRGGGTLLQSTGRTLLTMISQGTGAIINIIFDPIFIFGLFGFPKMGVAGAAYATILGQWVAAAIGLVMNIRKNPEVSISMKGFRPHGATLSRILAIGIPSVVMQSIGSVMTFLMNQILIAFSSTAVAVFGVYFKLQSFVFMPVFGLNNGTVPIVAYNFGARKGDRMKKTIKYSICAAVGIMIAGMLLFQSIPDKLLLLFDASDEMLRLGVPALRIISLGFPLAGFGIGAGSVFQALGYSVYSMVVSLIRQLVVLIPCAYVIGRVTGDVTGVWWAFFIAELVSLMVSALYLRRVNRNVIRTI